MGGGQQIDKHRMAVVALGGVIASLLIVGIVSGTILRHVIQVAPALVVLAFMLRGQVWATSAAFSIFAFWLVIMVLIWLYLVGVRTFFDGTFTPAEILLTILIGISCCWGLGSSPWGAGIGWPSRISSFAAFLGLQLLAMWVSLQPSLANR